MDETISNPCATSMLKKMFRDRRGVEWTILEKEVIDEIIFKTENHRDNPAACQSSNHAEVFRKSERYRSRAMD